MGRSVTLRDPALFENIITHIKMHEKDAAWHSQQASMKFAKSALALNAIISMTQFIVRFEGLIGHF